MNKLLFAPWGAYVFMDEAGGGGGGGNNQPAPPAPPADPGNPPAPPAPPADPGNPPAPPAPPADPGNPPAPPVNAEPTSAIEQKTQKPGDPPAHPEQPKEISDEDFLKAFSADDETKEAAGGDGFEFSQDVVKGMLPAFREVGISPEQANKLANAFARQQIAQAQAQAQERAESMRTANDAAFKMFKEKRDWELIGAARDHFFKPAKDGQGGAMLHTIAYTELGSDPEFLALLRFAGERLATDGTPPGGGAGPTGGKVDYAKALGLK